MNHELTIKLIWIGYYLAWITWIALTIFLLIGLLRKDWFLVKRTLKYIINSVVFWVAFMFVLELELIVKAPILATRQQSIAALQKWINHHQVVDVYYALVVLIILLSINLFFYYKLEQRRHKKDLIILSLGAIVILSFSIWLTGQDAYFGLLEEFDRHFF